MKIDRLGIEIGGERRLWKAVDAQVRAKHQDELSVCTSESQKVAIEEKIQMEIKDEMKRVASPYSLWSSG